MSPLYLHREWALFHGAHHVASPCFYSSPEQKNQKLALERAFHVFRKLQGHHMFFFMLGRRGWGLFSWLQSATSPLDATKSYTLVLIIKQRGIVLAPLALSLTDGGGWNSDVSNTNQLNYKCLRRSLKKLGCTVHTFICALEFLVLFLLCFKLLLQFWERIH